MSKDLRSESAYLSVYSARCFTEYPALASKTHKAPVAHSGKKHRLYWPKTFDIHESKINRMQYKIFARIKGGIAIANSFHPANCIAST